MKIAHTKTGLHLAFTSAEVKMLPSHIHIDVDAKAEAAFLLLRGVNAGESGRALVDCKTTGHPKRTMTPPVRGLPLFGTEEVELQSRVGGAGWFAARPPMSRPIRTYRGRSGRALKQSAPAVARPFTSLDQAVDIVNRYKDELGNGLVMEITDRGHLRVLVQFGRQ